MSETPTAFAWLLRNAVGGGLLLLLAWILMKRHRQPARQQRLGEWGLVAALLLAVLSLGPSWFVVPLLEPEPLARDSAPSQLASEEFPAPALEPWAEEEQPEDHSFQPFDGPALAFPATPPELELDELTPPPASTAAPEARSATSASRGVDPGGGASRNAPSPSNSLPDLLVAAYVLATAFLLVRWALGHVALWQLVRNARPAPPEAVELFQKMAYGHRRQPRLLVSDRLRVPVSCGLLRPTVLVPADLCVPGIGRTLRWVFAHELTHLERRDAWDCLLFGFGQAVYFYLPWFWWLRRQVRLCQEYVADAAAVAWAAQPADYAQFLLTLSRSPVVPLGATGVSGNSSDLFRRVTMLLQDPVRVEKRCPRRWSLTAAVALLALAVFVSGVSLRAVAGATPTGDTKSVTINPVPEQDAPKAPAKKDPPAKKEPKNRPQPDPNFDDLPAVPGLDPNVAQQMRERMQAAQQQMMQQMQQFQGQPFGMQQGFGGFTAGQFGEGRLGVRVRTPSDTLVEQLDLPKGQGLVIEHVSPNSAADKAGLKAHDILLELNGKTVPNDPAKLVRSLAEVKAKTTMDAVVLRKGKKETVKGITLPETKAFLQGGFQGMMPGGAGGMLRLPNGQFNQPGFGAGGGFGGGGGFGAGAGFQGQGNQTVITTNFRTDDRFTTRHQEGSLIITVTGTVADGKAKVSQVQIQDGRETHKYESVDKVPEQYRDKVKNLVEVNEKSNTRIELRSIERKRNGQNPEKD
jgi:beta-lactamase regulating signal transducer with metallopeptidase domain